RAEQERYGARAAYDPEPEIRAGERRPEPREQEHAGLDHRRRMQVRGHGRRCRHRMRQPEVERELRALRKHADQNEQNDRRVEAMRAYRIARREHDVELVAADDLAEEQDAEE